MTNVEVTKNPNESTTNLIRRFTKRVQGSGVLPRVRSVRYFKRDESEFKKKKQALRKIGRRNQFEELYKLGKVEERKGRGRGRR